VFSVSLQVPTAAVAEDETQRMSVFTKQNKKEVEQICVEKGYLYAYIYGFSRYSPGLLQVFSVFIAASP